MNCPRCGTEIPKERMFCPKCGYAIQMVPDYELDIEESIAQTRNEMAGALDSLIGPDGQRKVSQETVRLPVLQKKVSILRKAGVFVFGIVIILLVILFGASMYYFSSSGKNVQYLQNADEAYAQGNYAEAVELYEKAFGSENGSDAPFLFNEQIQYARALHELKLDDRAVSVLHSVIEEDPENAEAYGFLIEIHKLNDDYEEINRLLAGCSDDGVFEMYKDYMTMPPDFSRAGGIYKDEIVVELSASMTGDIYYTRDGSAPSTSSELYMGPIDITEGKTTITAIFVNPHDMISKPVRITYEVKFDVPDEPEIFPVSGNYAEPEYITVSSPNAGNVYYTTDGTDPTVSSNQYTDPIPMPLGKTTMKFAAISEKGVSSPVVEKNYNLNIIGTCSSEDATAYVAASLVATGALLDIYGNVPGVDGHYKYLCTKAAKEGSRIYYIIDEYFEHPNGTLDETGTIYAVDAISCMMYRAKPGRDGRYGFSLFY
ncbi:Tetratricopeptide repeat-containing protein [Lachnospiraceae bacterium]|nr:Tetratricopeptide repeat-containing protein [Lachnospiraceae bacterium]